MNSPNQQHSARWYTVREKGVSDCLNPLISSYEGSDNYATIFYQAGEDLKVHAGTLRM